MATKPEGVEFIWYFDSKVIRRIGVDDERVQWGYGGNDRVIVYKKNPKRKISTDPYYRRLLGYKPSPHGCFLFGTTIEACREAIREDMELMVLDAKSKLEQEEERFEAARVRLEQVKSCLCDAEKRLSSVEKLKVKP